MNIWVYVTISIFGIGICWLIWDYMVANRKAKEVNNIIKDSEEGKVETKNTGVAETNTEVVAENNKVQ